MSARPPSLSETKVAISVVCAARPISAGSRGDLPAALARTRRRNKEELDKNIDNGIKILTKNDGMSLPSLR